MDIQILMGIRIIQSEYRYSDITQASLSIQISWYLIIELSALPSRTSRIYAAFVPSCS